MLGRCILIVANREQYAPNEIVGANENRDEPVEYAFTACTLDLARVIMQVWIAALACLLQDEAAHRTPLAPGIAEQAKFDRMNLRKSIEC